MSSRSPIVSLVKPGEGGASIDRGSVHATHAELLRELGRPREARQRDERALALTANPAQQALLTQRLTWN
ncbi:hypothetical protein [Acrocarpospora sp. B8E8]|uniref:hypothetical protein n=1 Tax=Acrocarpospora sp. B8E8 TaxID=3153572 RepID=UPI00325F93DE